VWRAGRLNRDVRRHGDGGGGRIVDGHSEAAARSVAVWVRGHTRDRCRADRKGEAGHRDAERHNRAPSTASAAVAAKLTAVVAAGRFDTMSAGSVSTGIVVSSMTAAVSGTAIDPPLVLVIVSAALFDPGGGRMNRDGDGRGAPRPASSSVARRP